MALLILQRTKGLFSSETVMVSDHSFPANSVIQYDTHAMKYLNSKTGVIPEDDVAIIHKTTLAYALVLSLVNRISRAVA